MELNGRLMAAFFAINVRLGVDLDGIPVFSGGSSPNLQGDVLLHFDGGGSFLGPGSLGVDKVVTGAIRGSQSGSRMEASWR